MSVDAELHREAMRNAEIEQYVERWLRSPSMAEEIRKSFVRLREARLSPNPDKVEALRRYDERVLQR